MDLVKMLVFLKHRLVMLSMPKCGSTALEAAFASHADVVISGTPQAKHTPFRKYNRYLRAYFETFTDGPLEVVCAFREPIDWLGSWWRYRGRPQLAGSKNSTEGISFENFVEKYLAGQTDPAKVGRQAQFVSDKDGLIGVDQIWRYDRLDSFTNYLSQRLEVQVSLQALNVSPRSDDMVLTDQMSEQARQGLSREFEIYGDLAR